MIQSPTYETQRLGRPTVQEKREVKLTLSLTKAEARILEGKAGLVPNATFLMAKLREVGVFDKE